MLDKELKKLAKFFESKKSTKYKRGDLILQAGYEPSAVFFLKKGLVRQYSITAQGNEYTLNIFKPGAYFPLSWALANLPNSHYFQAMTEVELKSSPKSDFVSLINKNPKILLDLVKRIYIGLEGFFVRVETLMSKDARAKTASTLLILAKRFGKPNGVKTKIDLKLTEDEIAAYAGLTRETISRVLKDFRKRDLSDHQKGIYRVDIQKLEVELDRI